jgi:hypothetical protein
MATAPAVMPAASAVMPAAPAAMPSVVAADPRQQQQPQYQRHSNPFQGTHVSLLLEKSTWLYLFGCRRVRNVSRIR